MNQRVSSLISAIKLAESAGIGASVAQKILYRVDAHTGTDQRQLNLRPEKIVDVSQGTVVLVGLGDVRGHREGGLPGAATTLVLPELIASLTGQMIVARGLNSHVTAPVRSAVG
jgi:hypothetical protein